MNRCISLCNSCFVLVALLLGLSSGAHAQANVRPFPPNAQLGEMHIVSASEMFINGKPERLSPGARIRGTNNMLAMSGSLIGQTVWVKYQRESHGLVHEVWILTPAEIQATLPKQQVTLPKF